MATTQVVIRYNLCFGYKLKKQTFIEYLIYSLFKKMLEGNIYNWILNKKNICSGSIWFLKEILKKTVMEEFKRCFFN